MCVAISCKLIQNYKVCNIVEVLFYIMDVKPLKVGVLSKKARNRTKGIMNSFTIDLGLNWHDRNISLYPTHLKYDNSAGQNKGVFPLTSSSVILVSDVDRKQFAFKVTEAGEDFYLNCANEKERQEWMTAIKAACDPVVVAASNAAMLEEEKARQLEIARKAEEERLAAEAAALAAEAARVAALEALRVRNKTVQIPHITNKKLSNERSHKERFVWIETGKSEFHWGKDALHTFNSKGINLRTHLKELKLLSASSFSFELVEKSLLPPHLQALKGANVEVFFVDQVLCQQYVDVMRDLIAGTYTELEDPVVS